MKPGVKFEPPALADFEPRKAVTAKMNLAARPVDLDITDIMDSNIQDI